MGNALLNETAIAIERALGADLHKITVDRAVFGLFFSGVKLSNGQGGICFTPVKEIPEAVCCPSSAKAMPLSGRLRGRPIPEYLADLEHDMGVLYRSADVYKPSSTSQLINHLRLSFICV